MGRRFHKERFPKYTIKAICDGPCRWFKAYTNKIDRRRLNRQLEKEDPDIPKRWSHKHWGLWKWF